MVRKILYFFLQLLFLPHVLLFLFSSKKEAIISDIYSRKEHKIGMLNHCYFLSLELLLNTYFRTLFYYRTAGFFAKLLRIFYPKNSSFTIDVHTKIDGGLILAHPYSTILNANSIGKSLYVNHLVTVGETKNGKPTIGDNVELHAGCIVIGNISIGNNVTIGAGAVVTKNVPNNCTAVGNPARILEKNS